MPEAKRSFDFKRTDQYLCDPIRDLCIIGGATMPINEQGLLDTSAQPSHALHDPRITMPLADPFVRNIAALGVQVPIIIVKLDDVACVVDGRQRVRAARVVNRLRESRGEAPLTVPCIVKRVKDETALLTTMISTNEARTEDDAPTKFDKLKRLLDSGVSHAQAAAVFSVSEKVIEQWLRFDDMAIQRVKDAVDQGKLALSAGIEVARLKDPAAQAAQLDAIVASGKGKASTRDVRKSIKAASKPNASAGITSARIHRKLLEAVQQTPHPTNTSERTLAWWQGVEDALRLIVGADDKEKVEQRLAKLYTEILNEKGDK